MLERNCLKGLSKITGNSVNDITTHECQKYRVPDSKTGGKLATGSERCTFCAAVSQYGALAP